LEKSIQLNMAKLIISQQEYQKLRDSGISQDEIINKYSEKPSTVFQKVSKVADAVTDFVGARGIVDQYGSSIARTSLKLQGKDKEAELVGNPELRTVVGSAIQTGANFIPGAGAGASLTTKALIGAGTGYAMDVGNSLQQGKKGTDAFTPRIGTVAGGSLPIVGKLVGLTTKNAPRALSEYLEKVNFRMTPTERTALETKSNDIAEYLSKKKLTGSPAQRYAKLSVYYDDMERQIEKTVAKAPVTYNKNQIVEDLNRIPDGFVDDPELYSEAQTTIKKLVDVLKEKRGDALTANAVNEYKRKYMKRAFAKNTSDVISESRLAIASQFKKMLDDSIPELKGINKEYGTIIASRKILKKAIGRAEIGLTGKLIGMGTGAMIGQAVGGPAGGAVGLMAGPAIGKRVAGTYTRSVAGSTAQTISQIAEKIQKLPTDGLGNISQKALLDLLESLRGSEPESQ